MRRHRLPVIMIVLLGLIVAACGDSDDADGDGASPTSDTTSGDSGEQVLRMAFTADMDPPDPDTNYQLQGNQVTTSLYEGLLDYAPDSTSEIVPLLAESYEVSDDGLSYTFTLREGLTFSDGTPLDSEALLAGFERRVDPSVESPMSYMLLPVDSYETPDPLTFVINLKYPESAFLSYLASPFSPKAVNPAVLAEHADDASVEYLQTNSAGSGPYVIEEFQLGQRYVLARNESYWGEEPYFDRVEIRILPDAASQVLQLEGGDLDIITGQPIATVRTFEGREDFEVVTFPVLQKAWLHINTGRTPTNDPAFRAAIRSAIDRPQLVEQIWGDFAATSTQMYPVQNLPEGLGSDEWEFDPAVLEGLAGDETIELAYPAARPADLQVVETLQAQLGAAGLDVVLVPTQDADLFAWPDALDAAPHLYYEVSYPDSSHPDTWSRLFWYSDLASGAGGFLNYLGAGTPESDDAMNTGLGAVEEQAVNEAYDRSADLLYEQAAYVTLADPEDVFIARAGLSGFAHWLPTPLTLQLKSLTEG